jgi:D-aminoacyl-tRNA deacylase
VRLVVQRVSEAKVVVEGKTVGSIERGLLVLFGVRKGDALEGVRYLAQKLVHLRCFTDSQDKMNLSVLDIKGGILIVSQFTLYADCSHGRRPDFFEAEGAQRAQSIYESFVQEVKTLAPAVETGIFGAAMQVHLINDGPVTFLIDL